MLGRRRGAPAPTGPTIEGYRDFELIGAGGYSKVYTARQEAFSRTVAVKVITVELDDAARRRFAREREMTGQLDGHPHIVRVYDTGETTSGQPYLAMEHHRQGSLADRVRREGPLPLAEVLRVGVLLAGALDAAHRRGIVHRDVKPQNVLLSTFVGPVLADFGIAAVADARLTTVGHEAFSVLHAAPEVLDGGPATPVADLYSLASTLYELLTGRAPFADDERPGLLALLHRARNDPLPPIERPDVPPEVADGLLALLARDPADRPAGAVPFAHALQALEEASGLTPTPLVLAAPGPGVSWPVSPWARPPARTAGSGATGTDSATPRDSNPTPAAGSARSTPSAPPVTPRSTGAPPPKAPAAGRDRPDRRVAVDTLALPPRARRRPAAPAHPEPTGTPRNRTRLAIAVIAGSLGAIVLATGGILTARSLLGEPVIAGPATTEPPGTTTVAAPGPTGALPPCPPAPTGDLGARPLTKGQPPQDLVVQAHPDGRSADVRWTDPNGGTNAFVVFLRCAGAPDRNVGAVRAVAPGRPPAVTVDGLRLDLNYCFSVGVVEPTGGTTLFTDPADRTQFRCLDGTRQ